MRIIITCILASVVAFKAQAQLVHQFNSPSFSGQGFSTHALTIEQLEATRRQKIKDEAQAAIDRAEREKKNSNIAKFLVNVESRIYAQLSKQMADAMFSGGQNSGTMDFQGTTISWIRTGSDVTLTILEANGNRTDITVPVASFAF